MLEQYTKKVNITTGSHTQVTNSLTVELLLKHTRICSRSSREQLSTAIVQLVCLLPVGIFNHAVFISNIFVLCLNGMSVN